MSERSSIDLILFEMMGTQKSYSAEGSRNTWANPDIYL